MVGLHRNQTLHKYIQVAITFSLTCFAWIFFRANTLSEAFCVVKSIFLTIVSIFKSIFVFDFVSFKGLIKLGYSGLTKSDIVVALILIFFMECIHTVQRHGSIRHMFNDKPIWFRWTVYYILVISILFLGIFGEMDFIYFQF